MSTAILADLGVAAATPLIEVWNKIDLVAPEDRDALAATRASGLDDVEIALGADRRGA